MTITAARPISENPYDRLRVYGKARYFECRTGLTSCVVEVHETSLGDARRRAADEFRAKFAINPYVVAQI